MSILRLSWTLFAFIVGTLTILLAGCIVPYGDRGYDGDVGVGVSYYEPVGVEYGGWGPGYQVAPFRGGDHRPNGGGGHGSQHNYKSAPASRSIPSLPSHGSGGGRGGSRSHGDGG